MLRSENIRYFFPIPSGSSPTVQSCAQRVPDNENEDNGTNLVVAAESILLAVLACLHGAHGAIIGLVLGLVRQLEAASIHRNSHHEHGGADALLDDVVDCEVLSTGKTKVGGLLYGGALLYYFVYSLLGRSVAQ